MAKPLRFDPIEEARRQWIDRDLGEPVAMAGTTSIMRAQQLMLAAVEKALRPYDLSFARYEALMLLSFTKTGSLPLAKLGVRLMVHPTSVTNTIDKLEEQALVRRVPHPTDRRATLATITPKGRRLAKRATSAVTGIRFGLSLPDHEIDQLVDLLRRVRVEAGDFDDAPARSGSGTTP